MSKISVVFSLERWQELLAKFGSPFKLEDVDMSLAISEYGKYYILCTSKNTGDSVLIEIDKEKYKELAPYAVA